MEDDNVTMEEILLLQQQLGMVQAMSGANKLSRSNCIEIIRKLQAMKLLNVEYTSDGSQYITPRQIKKEIGEEIHIHKGRISIADLEEIVGIDIVHVERAVDEIIAEDDRTYLVQGEIVNSIALDNIAAEVNELLQDEGQIDLSSMARRFNLSTDFLLKHLQDRVGSIIGGELDRNGFWVRTKAYRLRQEAVIRGYFSALTRPISAAQARAKLKVQDNVLLETIKKLVSCGRLAGTLSGKGDGTKYTPLIVTRTQTKFVDDFFKQNNYMEFDKASKLGMANPRKELAKAFPGGVALSTCYVAQTIADQLKGYVDEALSDAGDGFSDVTAFLPSCCSTEDILQLLESANLMKDTSFRCDAYVVSNTLLRECAALFEPVIAEKAASVPQTVRADIKKILEGGAGRAAEAAAFDDDDKKSKKKGRRAKKKDTSQSAEQTPDNISELLPFLSAQEIEAIILREKPILEDAPDLAEDMAASLVDQLQKDYEAAVAKALQSGGGTTSKRKQREDIATTLNAIWLNLNMFQASLHHLDDDNSLLVQKHLNRTLGLDLVHCLLQLRCQDEYVQFEFKSKLAADERKALLGKLPDDSKKRINELIQSTTSEKTLESFLEKIEDECEKQEVFLPQLDKQTKRALEEEHRITLEGQLAQTPDLLLALHITAMLLFQAHLKAAVNCPGRCVPYLISVLQAKEYQHWETLKLAEQLVMSKDKDEQHAAACTDCHAQLLALALPQT